MLKKNKAIKRSIRIPVIILVDLLLISISFFITDTFMAQYIDIAMEGNLETFRAFAIYDVVTLLMIGAFGGFRTKTLDRSLNTILSVFLGIVTSHFLCDIILGILGIHLNFGMVITGAISTVFVIVCHTLQKMLRTAYLRSFSQDIDGIPTLIIGAGFTGKMVYKELTENKEHNLYPVCFVDDDKDKIATEICGLNVYGPSVIIPELCKKHKIGMVVFAIPSCPPEERRRILSNCNKLGCDVRIVPSLDELNHKQAFFNQSKVIDVEKLLGRDAISIENSKVVEFLSGKSCLVTGGGGSIGSEICRQIVRMKPKKVVIVDIYENNAYDIQQELIMDGVSPEVLTVEIGSVRDMEKMRVLFEKYKFDVIFHAAAHKHVPLMETSPEEAIKNNVKGTYNIAHLAHRYNAQKMVLISTDKAVNPTNVMGASKRMCEMVIQYMSQTYKNTKYAAVRFGNVLGSNGSVIPLFTKQIEAGGPVTVTHPEIIRYFMTIPEAVSLVLEAGTMSNGGESFVLDMGEPVKILTLAENLIRMYGYKPYEDMKIEFCGLRKGEKLYEELLMSDETLKTTYNKKIFIMDQTTINCEEFKADLHNIIKIADSNNSKETVKVLRKIVPEFKTPDEVNGQMSIDINLCEEEENIKNSQAALKN